MFPTSGCAVSSARFGERRESRPTYEMRITTDEPPRRIDLVHRNLRKFGTVYNTLAAVCQIDGQLTATPTQNAD